MLLFLVVSCSIKNDLSPHWTKTFELEYEFGKPSTVNITIFDEVRKSKNDKSMGAAVFEIGEVLGSRGNIKAKKLKNGGTLFCRIQPAPDQDLGTFHFTLRGIKLKNVDGLFGKSDPFFEVSRLINAGGGPTWQVVYRSKVIKNDLNPKWEPVSLRLTDICGGDKKKTVLITVRDWQKNGKHSPMGFFETSVEGLLKAKTHGGTGDVKTIDTSKAFKLTRRGKFFGYVAVTAAMISDEPNTTSAASSSSSTTTPTPTAPATMGTSAANVPDFSQALSGPPPTFVPPPTAPAAATAPPEEEVYVPLPPPMAAPVRRPKFVDYLSGGLEFQLTVAVDYTGSNGDPRRPGTLHYIHRDGQLNDYEKALTAVGAIVGKYDSDQKFPAVGFGAKYGGVINHCFQLGPTAEASGIKGLLDAYRGTFRSGLVMSGPTVFSEVISMVAAQARSKQEASRRIGKQHYHILLILTDGAVTDVQQTKRAITAASDAPMSIVIVGIGSADFSTMQFLDDFQSQEGTGRDICQFVEFQRYRQNRMQLTQATLDEIPDQVVDYFHTRGIAPLPPISGSRVNVVPEEYNEDEEIDLTIDIDDNGDVHLGGGGYKDETVYATYSTFAAPSAPPGAPMAYAPQGFAPNQSFSQSMSYIPGAQPHQPYVPGAQPTYAPGAPSAPPYVPGAPPAPSAPPAQPYVPGAPPAPSAPPSEPYVPGAPPPRPTPQPSFSQSAIPVMGTLLSVQVPPGAQPGSHVQVQNPTSGQMVFVQVPHGLNPGQTFVVQV